MFIYQDAPNNLKIMLNKKGPATASETVDVEISEAVDHTAVIKVNGEELTPAEPDSQQ